MDGTDLQDGQRDAATRPCQVVVDELLPETTAGEPCHVRGPHDTVPQLTPVDPDRLFHVGVGSFRLPCQVVSMPPSTGSVTPDTYDAASLARNTTTAANSSTWPWRPAGMR